MAEVSTVEEKEKNAGAVSQDCRHSRKFELKEFCTKVPETKKITNLRQKKDVKIS